MRFLGPTSHWYVSQRLRLHYVDWGNEGAPPLLLIHGGRDHCRNWDWVAEALRDQYHIVAPDLRGHGDSQWMIGGYYSIVDYVADIAQLIHQRGLSPLTIMAHSLGGHVAMQYTGVFPQNVAKLVSVEGFGPPLTWVKARMSGGPQERMLRWTKQARDYAARLPRRYASLEEAIARMHEANPHLSPAQARHLTIHGVNQNEDGTYGWKFDNYVRAEAPYRFYIEEMQELWNNITCPTLLVRGTETWATNPETEGYMQYLKHGRIVHIEKAGHWVHHDQLDHFLNVVREFLGSAGTP